MLIFGVEDCGGKLGYAVVSGRENGCSLALCRDEQALAGYAALLEAKNRNADELEQISLELDQDCIECNMMPESVSGCDRWLAVFGVEAAQWPEYMPRILSRQPGMLSRPVNGEEERLIKRALLAAADYAQCPDAQKKAVDAKKNGAIPCARSDGENGFIWNSINLAGSMKLPFPSPALDDELAARRLRRIPVSGVEVRCAVRRLPMPMDDEGLRVPTVMMLVDDRLGVAAAPMVEDYERDYGSFAGEYIAYVEENGRPKRILASDPRTYCLLSGLAEQMSTPIQRVGSMPEINSAVHEMMEYLKAQVGADREDDDLMEEMTTDTPGEGSVFLGQFEGSMAECEKYILDQFSRTDDQFEYDERWIIRITYPEDPAFWLHAAVKKDASLRHLDQFIRNEWVECCGHSSLFRIGGADYTNNTRILPGKSMNAKLADVMTQGVPIDYEYDIGTPTELQAEIVGEIKLVARREKVLYMAQNYMPKYKCVRCGRRAELVSRPGMEPIAKSVICARCSREEEEIGRYLPLLNSPRTGVCGYGMWFDDEDDE